MDNQTFHILLAEDSLSDASLVRIASDEMPFSCQLTHFDDGESCLDFIEGFDGQIGMILLDLKLPKISGLEIALRIRKAQRLNNVPVIIMSTTDNPQEIRNCLEAGINHFITKPFEVEEYILKVKDKIYQYADQQAVA